MTPSGALAIACRQSVRLIGPAGRQTNTNTFMKSANGFGVCGAAIVATLSAFELDHSQVLTGE